MQLQPMLIIRELEQFPIPTGDVALTIGNFDGMHAGHRALLQSLKNCGGQSAVLTFLNHPSDVLRPEQKTCRICTLEHKLKLLEDVGVDIVLLLPFTRSFSQQTAEEFIRNIRTRCPFTHLFLGHDAVIGKERSGDRAHLKALATIFHFQLDYLDEKTCNGIIISSSQIRSLIRQGLLKEAEQLLDRPYSIYAPVQTGQGLGKKIGFPTININVDGLCLPPLGVYAVDFVYAGQHYGGVANLGIAPTVRQDPTPILEVHLFEPHPPIENGSLVEVVLLGYLRPEQKFANVDILKAQIALDVKNARSLRRQ